MSANPGWISNVPAIMLSKKKGFLENYPGALTQDQVS